MNPAWWLVIWLVSTAVACTLVAWAVYWVGYDHGEREAAERERGRHRHAAPAEKPPVPDPFRWPPDLGTAVELATGNPGFEWSFFGGAQIEPQPGAAEYELMTQKADGPPTADRGGEALSTGGPSLDETPSAFTRRMAAEVGAMIAGWEAQGNYDRHLIYARDRT